MNQIHGGDIYTNPGVLDFSSNANPLGTPESVINAAKNSLENTHCYPDIKNTRLLGALSEYEGVPERQIILGNGAAEVIFSFVRAAGPKKALLPVPAFAEYGRALEAVGCETIKYPMDNFMIGDNISDYLEDDTGCAFICSPNNPTGFLTDNALLEKIIKKCQEKNIYLLLDECFLDFVPEGASYSMKRLLDKYDRLFILNSFTKRYAMAGLRLGYGLCADRALLDKMEKMNQPWNISIPAQAAGEAALKEKDYLEKARVLVNEQREYLKAEMASLGLEVFDSKANYIFFRGPEDLYERCLEKGILIRGCSDYEGLCRGYYRTAVRKESDNNRLLTVLREIMAGR